MTTFTNFVPTTVAAFQFQATLDSEVYTVVVTWNLFRQGFYVNVYDAGGTLITSRAMVGSPTGIAIESLTWANGRAIAATSVPHGYKVGTIVELTITNCAPAAFNGLVQALITGPSTFSWALASDPGAATAVGTASYNIDLTGGYFETSTMVFRQQSQQFEVSP